MEVKNVTYKKRNKEEKLGLHAKWNRNTKLTMVSTSLLNGLAGLGCRKNDQWHFSAVYITRKNVEQDCTPCVSWTSRRRQRRWLWAQKKPFLLAPANRGRFNFTFSNTCKDFFHFLSGLLFEVAIFFEIYLLGTAIEWLENHLVS